MRALKLLILLVVSYVLLLISVELRLLHPNWLSAGFGYLTINLSLYSIHFIPELIASTRWPTVHGEVIVSEFKHFSQSPTRSTRAPRIVYSYNVDGIEYQSERLKIGAQDISSNDWNWSQRILDKYHVGKEVLVYFNPNKPSKALIEPGMNLRIGFFGILAVIFFIVSWVIGLIFIRARI